MRKSQRLVVRGSLVLLLGLTIAACGSSKDTPNPQPTTPPPVVVRQEDQFGMAFANAFRADNNSEPFSPQDGDIVAISFTTEPVSIN